MKSKVDDLPVAHETIGEMIRGTGWGGMTSAYMQYPTGLDFCPLLDHRGVSLRGRGDP